MSDKKWFVFLLIFTAVIVIAWYTVINVIIDPYGVFGTCILKRDYQINERFVKIAYLESAHIKYNSYIFGSSRVGTTDPRLFDKYVLDSKFYNMTASNGNLFEAYQTVCYFLREGYEVDNLYVQLDIDLLGAGPHDDSDYLRRMHPYVNNKMLIKAYWDYFTIAPYTNIKNKLLNNYYDKGIVFDIDSTGVWRLPDRIEYIKNNPEKHLKGFVPQKTTKRLGPSPDRQLNELIKLIELCKIKGINLIIGTTAHNVLTLDKYYAKAVTRILDTIVSEHDVWLFSLYNEYNANPSYYFEKSHYTEELASLIVKRMFSKSEEFPKDFGLLVTKGNLNDMKRRIEMSFENREIYLEKVFAK